MIIPATAAVPEQTAASAPRELTPVLAQIDRALRGLRFGEIVIDVRDGNVVRVERTEKVRFYLPSP